MKRRPVGVPWWGEVCLSVRTPWDRAYSPGVLSCIGAIARAPERELMRKSEGCWCQRGGHCGRRRPFVSLVLRVARSTHKSLSYSFRLPWIQAKAKAHSDCGIGVQAAHPERVRR